MTRSEELERQAFEAEDNGSEVYVQRHDTYDIIEYLEIDGNEIYNPDYLDEVKDAYWLQDSYNIAERYWRM